MYSKAIELRINKGTLYLFVMGRGDFSRSDFGRLKPPLPEMNASKTSFITFAKLNNIPSQGPTKLLTVSK